MTHSIRFLLILGALFVPLLLSQCMAYKPGRSYLSLSPSLQSDSFPKAVSDRRGLATNAGDEVLSQIRTAEKFYRTAETHPDVVAAVRYSDEKGAKFMAEKTGGRVSKGRGWITLAPQVAEMRLMETWGREPLSYFRGGDKTCYFGRAGDAYCIEIRNLTNERIEVVVSVDGLDVLKGKPANYASHGFLCDGKKTIRIIGFQSKVDRARLFQLAHVDESLAAKRGGVAGARNAGVIGIALWKEHAVALGQANLREEAHREQANPFPGL